jgi:FtsP/CotA-like multicopper oxidase with cupredoxin domain
MIGHFKNALTGCVAALAVVLVLSPAPASAAIPGITGTNFNLTARSGILSTPDGGSYLIWGYADGAGNAQYPGPTLMVNQGDTITVTLNNELNMPVSMIFPGMANLTVQGGKKALFTN